MSSANCECPCCKDGKCECKCESSCCKDGKCECPCCKNLSEFENGIFSRCISLTNVTIENGVKAIPFYMFQWCSSLTNITLPDSITEICQCGFISCTSLTNINIPNSVNSIGENAFELCSSITKITIGNIINSQSFKQIFQSISSKIQTLILSEGVSEIRYEAFSNYSSLTEIIKFLNFVDKTLHFEVNFQIFDQHPFDYYGQSLF